jgi:hypothetical protein
LILGILILGLRAYTIGEPCPSKEFKRKERRITVTRGDKMDSGKTFLLFPPLSITTILKYGQAKSGITTYKKSILKELNVSIKYVHIG